MKNYVTEGEGLCPNLRKLFLKMKLTAFILILIVFQSFAESTLAQGKFSLDIKNKTVEEVLLEIENQSDFGFMYNKDLVDVTQKVNIDVKNASIDKILNQLFPAENVSFHRVNYQIVISPKFETVQQQKTISGTITDESGEPLPGVTVLIKGTTNGTVTDIDGRYTISNIGESAILQFSFVGMLTQEVAIGGQTKIDIVLQPDAIGIEEIVAVGYGTQKKINITGSIASVNAEELEKIPVASSSNALAGRMPGLIAQQASGQPGNDQSNLSIRGFGNALVIVDGIESDFNNIDASQIESVTVLKDGAASIYGSRAGNGVILVTTKRGTEGKPTVTFNGSYTLQTPTYFQDPLNSGEYTTLLAEQHLQSGQPEETVPYTPEQIEKYYEATEPGFYNTDWASKILRDYAPMQHYNLSLRGGADAVKYYAFLGAMNQESFWKKNGGDYNRYNFQTNLDAEVTDNLSMGLTVSYIVDDKNSTHRPQSGGGYLFDDLYNNKPMYPDNLPDPTRVPYSGSQTGGALVQSNRELGGYTDDDFQTFTGSVNLEYDLKAIKGLSFKAFGNYKQIAHQQKSFARPVDLYTYNTDTEEYTLASQFNPDSPLFQQKSETTSVNGQFSVSYKNTFHEAHDVSAIVLYEIFSTKYNYISARRSNFTFPSLDQMFAGSTSTQSNDGSASEMGRVSYVGRINYGYKQKYLAEIIIRADASAKFSPDSRWGYFPSVSLGWRINEEPFMDGLENLDNLKLRMSYGESGNDRIGNFQYIAGYTNTLMPALWNGVPTLGITARGMADGSFSWEEMAIYNAGLDYSFYNRKFFGEVDVFYRKRTGILARRTVSLPSTFGIELPLENLNSQNARGFELKFGTSGKYNDLKWDVIGNVGWQRAKWDHYEEIAYTDPDSKRINQLSGQWVDRTFGYLTDGLFTSQEEIDNLTFSYQGDPILKPGDVKFVDTNKDGVLDWKDQVEIGKGQIPNWTAGLSMNFAFRNFDMSALVQGAFGFYKQVSFKSFTKTFFDNRWTEQNNNPNALIPRLGGAGPNYISDRNFIKSDYVRLKNITIGYTLSKSITDKVNIQSARFFIGGTNLLTLSKLSKYDIDAESPFSVQDGQPTTSYYPQQKTVLAGVSLKF